MKKAVGSSGWVCGGRQIVSLRMLRLVLTIWGRAGPLTSSSWAIMGCITALISCHAQRSKGPDAGVKNRRTGSGHVGGLGCERRAGRVRARGFWGERAHTADLTYAWSAAASVLAEPSGASVFGDSLRICPLLSCSMATRGVVRRSGRDVAGTAFLSLGVFWASVALFRLIRLIPIGLPYL